MLISWPPAQAKVCNAALSTIIIILCSGPRFEKQNTNDVKISTMTLFRKLYFSYSQLCNTMLQFDLCIFSVSWLY